MVKLNVEERLVALSIMPRESNFLTLRLIQDLNSKLAVTPEEITAMEIVELEGGRISFNKKAVEEIEFELSGVEIDLIRKELKDLDARNKLVKEMISLYMKFC